MKFEEKHRPQNFGRYYLCGRLCRTYRQRNCQQRHKHLILHGPRGAGKSETAKPDRERVDMQKKTNISKCSVRASALEDKSLDILTGNWNYQRAFGMLHGCLIIEEVDQLKPGMRKQALRAIVDEHTFGIIICTTNNLHWIDQPLKIVVDA